MPKPPSPAYMQLSTAVDNLVAQLVDHPSMTAEVTLDTKPRNKIQLAYEYFTRIQTDLKRIDPSLPDSQEEQWHDVTQRTYKAHVTICEQPQALNGNTMEKGADETDFGDDIRAAAAQLVPKGTMSEEDGESAIA